MTPAAPGRVLGSVTPDVLPSHDIFLLFHDAAAAAAEKLRGPKPTVLVRGVTRSLR